VESAGGSGREGMSYRQGISYFDSTSVYRILLGNGNGVLSQESAEC